MKIWRLIKYFTLEEYERQHINNSVEVSINLFNFFYFIKWKSDIPSFAKIDRHMKRTAKFFYRARIYGRIGLITYFLLTITFSIMIKNPPFYLSILVILIAFIIDWCISLLLTRRNKVKFCVSLLVYDLVMIIILLEGMAFKSENIVNSIVNMEERNLSEIEKKNKAIIY
jgi:hypothetical protein